MSDVGDDTDSFLRGNKERDRLSNLRTTIVLKELSYGASDEMVKESDKSRNCSSCFVTSIRKR